MNQGQYNFLIFSQNLHLDPASFIITFLSSFLIEILPYSDIQSWVPFEEMILLRFFSHWYLNCENFSCTLWQDETPYSDLQSWASFEEMRLLTLLSNWYVP